MSAIIESATIGTEEFKTKMAEIFPTFMVAANVRNLLGACVVVEFINAASLDDLPSRIALNATGHMRFMMHLSNSKGVLADGTPVEIELLTWACRQSGIKFRKIKAKTPAEALQKLAAWFAKNADIINSL